MALAEGSVEAAVAVLVVVEDTALLFLTVRRCRAMGCRPPTCIPRPLRTGADIPLRAILLAPLVSLPVSVTRTG